MYRIATFHAFLGKVTVFVSQEIFLYPRNATFILCKELVEAIAGRWNVSRRLRERERESEKEREGEWGGGSE
jgi:hypothetical protein